MSDCGVLKRTTVRFGGTFSFYAIDKNYELLIFTDTYKKADSKKQNVPNQTPIDDEENFSKNSKSPNYANFESKNFPKLVTTNPTAFENSPSEFEKNPDQKINLLNSSKKINKNLVDTSIEYQLGAFLFSKIKELNPKCQTPNLVKWSKDCYKLLNIDNRTLDEVYDLVDWIFTPGNFWSCRILSPAKLRKKFDELLIIKDYEQNKFNNTTHTKFKTGSDRYDLAGFEVIG